MTDRWDHIPAAPTRQETTGGGEALTAADLFGETPQAAPPLGERLRQTYFWISSSAVISPYYDVAFSPRPPLSFPVGDAGAAFELPSDQSYSSAVLLPLLSFAVGGRCLLVGGPGRGKTTVAVLMGVLAGSSPAEVRRSVVQGQPQLTVGDLVGAPLPKDLMAAERLAEVRVAWRGWLRAPVKIVDEYNRIPTKTQSALLTMVAEGYVESYDQMLVTAEEAGVNAWYFTANDDAGGGTFPVIQALRDRMDVTVAALGFNSRFLAELVARVSAGERPEEHVPAELRFSREERLAMRAAIRAVPVTVEVGRRLEYFASHFEFSQHAGSQFEYRTKDAAATAGADVGAVIELNTGADLESDPGAQTVAGLSVRALQTLILYAKAMAWFRGVPAVTEADVAAVLPFVLRDKLRPNPTHPLFAEGRRPELLLDPVAWLRRLWADSCDRFRALDLDGDDPVGALLAEAARGFGGLDRVEVSRRVTAIESEIARRASTGKLYGHDYDDLVALKSLHQRYGNYARWLESSG